MAKTRRNRWAADLTQRERRKLRKKDLGRVKATRVRDRLEERRADQLQRGEETDRG